MPNYTQSNERYYQQKRFERGQKQQSSSLSSLSSNFYHRSFPSPGPQQQKLLAYLNSHNLTPADLADQTGLQAPVLIDWLQSDTLLPLHLLAAIGPLLGIEAVAAAQEGGVTIAAHVPLATPTTTTTTVIKTKITPGKPQTLSSNTPTTTTTAHQKKMKPGRVSRTRIHRLVLPPSPTAFAQSTSAATAASTLTATASTASPVKGATPGKPVAVGQIEMIRALLIKKKTESEGHLVARLCGGRPLEELTHAEARRVLWDLTQDTHGGLQAIREAEQRQKIEQKAQQQRRAAHVKKVANSGSNNVGNSKKT